MIKTALFAAAAALATVATAAPALAKDVAVHYGDLDLSTAKGQSALAGRIHRAAQKACDFENDGHLPSRSAMDCYRQARSNVQTQVASLTEDSRLGG